MEAEDLPWRGSGWDYPRGCCGGGVGEGEGELRESGALSSQPKLRVDDVGGFGRHLGFEGPRLTRLGRSKRLEDGCRLGLGCNRRQGPPMTPHKRRQLLLLLLLFLRQLLKRGCFRSLNRPQPSSEWSQRCFFGEWPGRNSLAGNEIRLGRLAADGRMTRIGLSPRLRVGTETRD